MDDFEYFLFYKLGKLKHSNRTKNI